MEEENGITFAFHRKVQADVARGNLHHLNMPKRLLTVYVIQPPNAKKRV
jgi:hypothetical protein